jgi:hypothetical protein
LILLPLAEGIALIVIIAAGAWYFLMRPGPDPTANAPARLSIVVPPFAKVAIGNEDSACTKGDAEHDHFTPGRQTSAEGDVGRPGTPRA